MSHPTLAAPAHREHLVRRGLRLEYLTVGWNVIEGIIGIAAALAAGSVALLGFAVDSFIECASGGVLLWRLLAEKRNADSRSVERIEQRAQRLVGASLLILAAYIAIEAALRLARGERPEPSPIGIALTATSLGVMWWLARAKARTAVALGSRAMKADAFQTTACWWLSLVVLGGVSLNALLGWWWADPFAALGVTYFLVREGRDVWRGDECCEV
jgi:cation diffusion facilitator family transporter